MGTLYWMTFVIIKSRPLAATSVEMSILALDFWNFSNLSNLCFWIIWECRITALRPADQMKNLTLFDALMVLVKIIIFEFSGNSLMQHSMTVILSTSDSQNAYFYFSLAGRKICELWSIILGLASNLIRERRAFSFGMY